MIDTVSNDIVNECNGRIELLSPTAITTASGYLWNRQQLVQVNCRGYVSSQFMQPEPGRYSRGPMMEAKSFMQPEQPHYSHHPGRFFFIKDEASREVFSAPYEPMRVTPERFRFILQKDSIEWQLSHLDLDLCIELTLANDHTLELWRVSIRNKSERLRKISIYPYFSVGYMSWMNQSANFQDEFSAIVCRSATPYQKLADYPRIKTLNDCTVLLAERPPTAWDARQSAFEGEGGLHAPDGVFAPLLSGSDACHETPVAAMQYRTELPAQASVDLRFAFGPCHATTDLRQLRCAAFANGSPAATCATPTTRIMDSPDPVLDRMFNLWLARQVTYHSDLNRMTCNPQTRNYLQDQMGMCYLQKPDRFRSAFLLALSQQSANGDMPDGILLNDQATQQYINQVPHSDHCVWPSICLAAYLDETDDYGLLQCKVPFADAAQPVDVFEHMQRAMHSLVRRRDGRGLSLIDQGDWCDPMNGVGPRGKGVSGWLSLASIYAMREWARVCDGAQHSDFALHWRQVSDQFEDQANQYLWDGRWYARGITDDNVTFGIDSDTEGRLFLNPQSFAMLAGVGSDDQRARMVAAIDQLLSSPYGVELLAPAYTSMREDVGRLTQKFPGSAENGSVYCHAAAFYIHALLGIGEPDRAYDILCKLIPQDQEDCIRRGQLANFIPNYYRGAIRQLPRTAGRSSQLIHTGTVAWLYRSIVERMFGLRGCRQGLLIDPQLPGRWQTARLRRHFRGAMFDVRYLRNSGDPRLTVEVDGRRLARKDGAYVIRQFSEGQTYPVMVNLP